MILHSIADEHERTVESTGLLLTALSKMPDISSLKMPACNRILADIMAEDLIKSTLREKEVLLEEVQHRVKNNLLTISGILALQSEQIKDSKSKNAFITSMNRIKAMTKIPNQ